jgi:hypothetical protein
MENIIPDTSTSQVVLVSLLDLRDPSWNPRPFFDEAEMESLVAFMAAGGRIPPITIWKGSEQPADSSLASTHPNQGSRLETSTQGSFDIISGKRRCEAARRLGWTRIEAIKLDISLEDAKFQAIASNKDNKPFWLAEFIAVENLVLENQTRPHSELAKKLGWSEKRVSQAISLTDLLNPATRDQISLIFRQVVTARNLSVENKGNNDLKRSWQFTEDVAVRLIPLLENPSRMAAQSLAEKAVRIIIDRQLTGSQTDELMVWALAGKDLDQFEPAAKVRKGRAPTKKEQYTSEPVKSVGLESEKVPALKAESGAGHVLPLTGDPLHQEWTETVGQGTSIKAESGNEGRTKLENASPDGTPSPKNRGIFASTDSQPSMSETEQISWGILAGLSVIKNIQSKVRNGNAPNFLEAMIVVGWRLSQVVEWIIRLIYSWILKPGYKLVEWVVKNVWNRAKEF